MSLNDLLTKFAGTAAFRQAVVWLEGEDPEVRFKEFAGSTPAFLLQALAGKTSAPILCVTTEHDGAAYLRSDLEQLARDDAGVLLFPPTGDRPYDDEHVTDPTGLIQRAEVLEALQDGFAGIIVSSIDALREKVTAPDVVRENTISLSVGDELPQTAMIETLSAHGFERVDFVQEPGEFAVRGGIVDVYTFSGHYPLRIEFFGDEIDSLREFDPQSQRSVSRLVTVRIVPNVERGLEAGRQRHAPFLDYLPGHSVLFLFDSARFEEHADERYRQAEQAFRQVDVSRDPPLPAALYLGAAELTDSLARFRRGHFGAFPATSAPALSLGARPQPDFNSNMKLLRSTIRDNTTRGFHTLILCDNEGQYARLEQLLEEPAPGYHYTLKVESLHEGFEVPEIRTAVYTDHQIFNRYHRPTVRRRRRVFGGLSLREIRQLQPGDYVVHVDYGIGKFAGLERITVRGAQQEAARVIFRDDDLLYVNVNALHKLHKFKGKDGAEPRLTKLGTPEWERKKAKAKKRVKDIARDLIKLYAQRRASQGYAYSDDSIWQRELEASFEFEDTPDQAAASQSVKEDMEESVPMDRLVCGDVGFGKTEVAIRAAFKAVQDGKQAAVLVPTTILAAQHYQTFARRLQPFPVKVEMMSRFRSTAQQKEILADLEAGRIDVLIGTHRIVSKDVKFKNLGLLIVDEEQRFGVSVKERLRKLRVDVDTLTMTATPIPRTLQFSLLGARDLSIIDTPPANRQPIETEIHTFDKGLIRDAILYEVNRGGQVFFIHNRVQSIQDMAQTLRLLVPNVRFQVAHGQMRSSELEHVMLDFMDRRFDVLVCTNIIESGLDIPNANTIIINRADRFGLAELHQLRGRVGRSDRKAFCYLLTNSVHGLTREARQRLQALEELSDLGSGFHLAMRDLDIRGAGNLLGGEQSGFIEEIGFETYHRILDEAVQELREEEFSEVFKDRPPPPPPVDTQIDVEEDAYIPAHFVSNNVERLNIYRRIFDAAGPEALAELIDELQDRFGSLPGEVHNLFLAAEIKLLVEPLRLPKVQFKNKRLFLDLPADSDAYFYQHIFHPLLERLNTLGNRYVLKETANRTKLRAIVQEVPDLDAAHRIARDLTDTPIPVPA